MRLRGDHTECHKILIMINNENIYRNIVLITMIEEPEEMKQFNARTKEIKIYIQIDITKIRFLRSHCRDTFGWQSFYISPSCRISPQTVHQMALHVVSDAGPRLAFVVLPDAFVASEVPNVWVCLYYIHLVVFALHRQVRVMLCIE